jgi:hypothetical protein
MWKKPITVPVCKKSEKAYCNNYHDISLLTTSHKILLSILFSRLSEYMDEIIGDPQCVFRYNRSTTDQIFCIHEILEKKKNGSTTR